MSGRRSAACVWCPGCMPVRHCWKKRNLDQRLLVLVWNTNLERACDLFLWGERIYELLLQAVCRKSDLDFELGLIDVREICVVWHLHRFPKLPRVASVLWKRWTWLNMGFRESLGFIARGGIFPASSAREWGTQREDISSQKWAKRFTNLRT